MSKLEQMFKRFVGPDTDVNTGRPSAVFEMLRSQGIIFEIDANTGLPSAKQATTAFIAKDELVQFLNQVSHPEDKKILGEAIESFQQKLG